VLYTLLYMCPHTHIFLSSYTSICLSSYISMHVISRHLVPLYYSTHYHISARLDISMCPRMHLCMCPHMLLYKCWLIYFLYMCSHMYTSAELLLYIPAAIGWASIYMCPHIQAQNYRCVLIYRHTLYMCPHI
jgi:hypothetical protein